MESWIPHIALETVDFSGLSSADLGLILIEKTVGAPTAKVKTIDIPGADDDIDITEFFGDINYDKRKISLKFITKGNHNTVFARVNNELNGKKLRITLSSDEEYFFLGRVEVSDWSENNMFGYITINANCEAYRYKKDITSKIVTLTEAFQMLNLKNDGKKVLPTITATGSGIVKYQDKQIQFTPGKTTLYSLVLQKGNNEVEVSGTGSLTIEYQERIL